MATVQLLRRFPVKSMLGERPDTLTFDERGVTGDRLWAVRTASGKYAAEKHTPRFRRVPGLHRFIARYEGAVPCLTFPDGQQWRGDDPDVHQALSQALGQPVRLAHEESVSLLDAGPGMVHILTTASIEYARKLLPDSVIDERRFRPNLLLTGNDAPIAWEDQWVGRTLTIGTARFTVVERTERCVMVNHAREGLPRDGRVLRTLWEACEMRLGIYAKVTTAGMVSVNDRVNIDW